VPDTKKTSRRSLRYSRSLIWSPNVPSTIKNLSRSTPSLSKSKESFVSVPRKISTTPNKETYVSRKSPLGNGKLFGDKKNVEQTEHHSPSQHKLRSYVQRSPMRHFTTSPRSCKTSNFSGVPNWRLLEFEKKQRIQLLAEKERAAKDQKLREIKDRRVRLGIDAPQEENLFKKKWPEWTKENSSPTTVRSHSKSDVSQCKAKSRDSVSKDQRKRSSVDSTANLPEKNVKIVQIQVENGNDTLGDHPTQTLESHSTCISNSMEEHVPQRQRKLIRKKKVEHKKREENKQKYW